MTLHLGRATAIGLCALSLAGCVDSAAPILSDAKPLLGERLNLQLYSLRSGFAAEPEQVSYVWNGKYYTRTKGARSMNDFTVHAFESGDFIIQTVASAGAGKIEYALLHPLTDGVYYVAVIDEADTDQATRSTNCDQSSKYSCRVTTREQVFAMARATAAHHKDSGGLAIRLADRPEKTRRRP